MDPGQAILTVQDYGANQDGQATWRQVGVQGLALEMGQELQLDQGLELESEQVAEEPGTGCLASRGDMAGLEPEQGLKLELELELGWGQQVW